MSNEIVIEVPTWALLVGWLAIKLAAATVLQHCYIATRSSFLRKSAWQELKTLSKHFVGSFLFYPEATVLWACVWPVFASITHRWHPKYILPGVVIDYLEERHV
jgi:hypothetical protein